MGDGHKAMTTTRRPELSYAAFAREAWADFDDVRKEYDTAMRNAQLLAGKNIREAISKYDNSLQEACRKRMDTGAKFDDWAGRERVLMDEMRTEVLSGVR